MSSPAQLPRSQYLDEYLAAFDRTNALGLQAPPRVLVQKDCVDLPRVMNVLLEYFERHDPKELMGQTAAIHFALVPLLWDKTGVPFNLTIGWLVRNGKEIFRHDESTLKRFLREGMTAWRREGMPFHLWLTSPAAEVVDVTFAMNTGWCETRSECAEQIVYQSAHAAQTSLIYHPMLVGPYFFHQSGAVA